MLKVSGLLDAKKVGGPSGDIDDSEFFRRAVYGKVSRFQMAKYHATFDFPNPGISASQRFVTSVPLQRLYFMNSKMVFNAASKVAELASKAPDPPDKAKDDKKDEKAGGETKPVELTDEQKVANAYKILFQRAPSPQELAAGLEFLADKKNQKAEDDYRAEPVTAWKLYARALLSSNEFLFMN